MNTRQVFSTGSVPAPRALEAWRDYMSQVYYQLDIEPFGTQVLRGELVRAELESVGVSHFKANAQRVIRRQAAASRDAVENFVFLFPTRQPMQYEQRGHAGQVLPGDVVMLNSSESYAVNVPDDSENITLKIPSDLLRPRVRGIDGLCARTRPGSVAMVPVVSQLGAQLLTMGPTQRSLRLQDAVVDLIGIMLEIGAAARMPDCASIIDALYLDAKTSIARRFREPLTPEMVAKAHRISVRYLHKAFASHQTTFGRVLMEVRLEEARRMLKRKESPGPAPHIAQIAYTCGFSTAAHFSARYRERYGLTPMEEHRSTLAPVPQADAEPLRGGH